MQVNIDTILRLTNHFDLGHVSKPASRLKAGLLNEVWKFTADTNHYVVKYIHPNKVRTKSEYQIAEKIASKAEQAGIACVPAIQVNNHQLFEFNDQLIFLYPFIDAHSLPLTSVTPAQAKIIGSELAKLHTLQLQSEEAFVKARHLVDESLWKSLQEIAVRQNSEVIVHVLKDCDQLNTWNEKYCLAAEKLDDEQLVSHRDLNQGNVIWNGETPFLIDWEWAGPINPHFEAIHSALVWAGLMTCEFNQESYQAFLTAYQKSGIKLTNDRALVLNATYGLWLDWLAFSMQLVLSPEATQSDIDLGTAEVKNTYNILKFIDTNIGKWKKL